MAGVAKLFGGQVFDKSNQEVNLNNEKYQGKVFGLYFSAHWCPPCRGFTPVLIEFYNKHGKNKNLEIIFLSSDNDEESFNEYYKDMPWLKLDYHANTKKDELSNKFHVSGIPRLVLLDGNTGEVICDNARGKVQQDKEGENFPWN